MIRKIEENSISIDEFYSRLPELHKKYQREIDKLDKSFCHNDYISVNTTDMVVFAQTDCIDSVVNINALKCIIENSSIEVSIVINKEILKEFAPNRKTPYIIGLDSNSNILWEWERVPEVISEIEDHANQVDIILRKRDYRHGKCLEDTVTEILEKLK